jgi:hypothetical protein
MNQVNDVKRRKNTTTKYAITGVIMSLFSRRALSGSKTYGVSSFLMADGRLSVSMGCQAQPGIGISPVDCGGRHL